MAEPSLTQVFGAGVSQTATQLIIDKADLAAYGLTADANNTGESLFVAILLQASNYLTSNNFALNEPEQQIAIGPAGEDLYTGGSQPYIRHNLFASLYVPTAISSLDPDDF